MSLYIYRDLRLRSNESRDHYHEDGDLVPSPRCGFGFEAAFMLWGLKLNIPVYEMLRYRKKNTYGVWKHISGFEKYIYISGF